MTATPSTNELLIELRRVAMDAAQRGAETVRSFGRQFSVSHKGHNDLVTSADVATQTAIESVIRNAFPDHAFVGEESVAASGEVAGQLDCRRNAPIDHPLPLTWIVDPIDGTCNFVHGLPGYAVSVAVCRNGNEPLVGVVIDPVSQETFVAVDGQGAWLNDQPIRASGCTSLKQALIASSFPPRVTRHSPEVAQFAVMLERAQSLRRLGSAALNLCYVASGRLDAYWASCVNAWDIAAGLLLVREAGGYLLGMDGLPVVLSKPRFIAAATRALYAEIAESLRDAEQTEQNHAEITRS